MIRKTSLFIFLIVQSIVSLGQKAIVIDGDELYLKHSLDGKLIFLDSIVRKNQQQGAFWIQYNRRPGTDPWIRNPIDGLNKFSDENFILYLKKNDIEILGALTTYDDCDCIKTKTMSSPDMYLINFKIVRNEWEKFMALYSEITNSQVLK